jgi:ferredoxin-type protein NapH
MFYDSASTYYWNGTDYVTTVIPNVPVVHPLLMVPVTQSPCSVWLNGYCNVQYGAWFVEPFGNLQALVTGNVGTPWRFLTESLFWPTIIALVTVVLLIVLIGAAFCSWVCPLGSIIDSFDMAIAKFLPKIEAKRAKRSQQSRNHSCTVCPAHKLLVHKNGYAATGVMATMLAASAIFKFNVFCAICPIGIATRGLFHLKSTTYLTTTLKGKVATIYYPLFIELVLVIPVFAVLLSLHTRRFWCNKICPVGATINGISTLNPFVKPVVVKEKCITNKFTKENQKTDVCGNCEKACPAQIKLLSGGSLHRCTKCMECYIACENNAVKIRGYAKPDIWRVKYLFKRKKKTPATLTVKV